MYKAAAVTVNGQQKLYVKILNPSSTSQLQKDLLGCENCHETTNRDA